MEEKSLDRALNKKENYIIIILWVMSGIAILCEILMCFHDALWLDESYTINMFSLSLKEMILKTGYDVHPPLYYLITALGVGLAQSINPAVDIIIVAKLMAVIPCILTWVISLTWIRKKYGNLCSALFAFCFTTMPQLTSLGTEARMYSYAMLFVTMAYLFACEIINSGKKRYWTGFTLCALAAAYTQYIACFSVAVLFVFLFIWLLRNNKKGIITLAVSGVVIIIAYLPWIKYVLSALSWISKDYWIPNITWGSIKSYITFALYPDITKWSMNVIFGIALGIMFLLSFIMALKSDNNHKIKINLWLGLCLTIGTVIISLVISLLMQPIFYARYERIVLPVLWLVFSISLGLVKLNPRIKYAVIAFIMLIGLIDLRGFVRNENFKRNEVNGVKQTLASISDSAILLFDNARFQGDVSYFNEHESLTWSKDGGVILEDGTKAGTIGIITDWMQEGREVWFVQKEYDVVLLTRLHDAGYDMKPMGSYSIPEIVFYPDTSFSMESLPVNFYIIVPWEEAQ